MFKFLLSCFLTLMLSGCSDMSDDLIPPVSINPSPSTSVPTTSNANSIVISPAPPHQIGVLLPLQGDLSNAAKAIQAGFNDAYQAYTPKPIIKIYDTASPGEDINTLYDKAVSEGANYIIGPLDKTKVATLEHHQNIPVITIALNNPDTPFYTPNLYEFALSPTDEAKQIADAASKNGYTRALMITPEGAWGQNIANVLQKQWENNGGIMIDTLAIGNNTHLQEEISTLLQVQGNTHREDIDVIFLVVQPSLARQIKALFKYDHAENLPVYSTSLVYSGIMSAEKDQDLNGVKFCDMPLVIAPEGQWAALRQQMVLAQPNNIQRYIRLYGLGYDAALLTQHFEKLTSGLSGATGNLSVDNHNDIIRKLNFAVFENGLPKTIS